MMGNGINYEVAIKGNAEIIKFVCRSVGEIMNDGDEYRLVDVDDDVVCIFPVSSLVYIKRE